MFGTSSQANLIARNDYKPGVSVLPSGLQPLSNLSNIKRNSLPHLETVKSFNVVRSNPPLSNLKSNTNLPKQPAPLCTENNQEYYSVKA